MPPVTNVAIPAPLVVIPVPETVPDEVTDVQDTVPPDTFTAVVAVAELPVHDPEEPAVFPEHDAAVVAVAEFPEHDAAVVAVAEFPEHDAAVVAVAELPVHDPEEPVVF